MVISGNWKKLLLLASAGFFFAWHDRMFNTAPEKGGIISSFDTPKSMKQRLNEMKRKQEAIAAVNRQQYQDMLKGMNTDKLDAQRKQYEQELSDMKTAYAAAMGLGEKKPKNQLRGDINTRVSFFAAGRPLCYDGGEGRCAPEGGVMDHPRNHIRTYTGVYMDPFEMRPEQVRAEDIAHALSLTTRANGHIHHFYSVAQHCVNCALEARARGLSRRVQLACLLHDASESYLADVPRPVKYRLAGYAQAEEAVSAVVDAALGVPELSEEELRSLGEIDDALLYYEFLELTGAEIFREAPDIAMAHDFSLRDMDAVEGEFLALYAELKE